MTAKNTTRKTAPKKTAAKKDPKELMSNLNLHTSFALDLESIKNGVWCDLQDGIRVRLRPYMNKEFVALLEKLRAPYKAQIRQGKMDEKIGVELAVKALCQEIITDWSGVYYVEDGEQKEVPYDSEFAYSILSKPEYVQLTDKIIALSQQQDMYKASYLEESEKN